MPLYHRDVGVPDDVQIPTGRIRLSQYSSHAINESMNDRYLTGGETSLEVHEYITLTESNVFEIEVQDGEIVKLCARVHYDDDRDIIYVLSPNGTPYSRDDWTVITLWINLKTDLHSTLDGSKYDTPS